MVSARLYLILKTEAVSEIIARRRVGGVIRDRKSRQHRADHEDGRKDDKDEARQNSQRSGDQIVEDRALESRLRDQVSADDEKRRNRDPASGIIAAEDRKEDFLFGMSADRIAVAPQHQQRGREPDQVKLFDPGRSRRHRPSRDVPRARRRRRSFPLQGPPIGDEERQDRIGEPLRAEYCGACPVGSEITRAPGERRCILRRTAGMTERSFEAST